MAYSRWGPYHGGGGGELRTRSADACTGDYIFEHYRAYEGRY